MIKFIQHIIEYMNTSFQLLAFIALLFFALVLNKYYNIYYTVKEPIKKPQQTIRCKPETKEVKKHDDTVNVNKNDLNIVNKKFNMYDNTNNITNDGFKNELGEYDKFDKTLTEELSNVYFLNEAKIVYTDKDENKPDKTDLPIANIPLCLLQNNKPLRLSEK